MALPKKKHFLRRRVAGCLPGGRPPEFVTTWLDGSHLLVGQDDPMLQRQIQLVVPWVTQVC